jgi:hypothetical protein
MVRRGMLRDGDVRGDYEHGAIGHGELHGHVLSSDCHCVGLGDRGQFSGGDRLQSDLHSVVCFRDGGYSDPDSGAVLRVFVMVRGVYGIWNLCADDECGSGGDSELHGGAGTIGISCHAEYNLYARDQNSMRSTL